jgi:hypothetical protein
MAELKDTIISGNLSVTGGANIQDDSQLTGDLTLYATSGDSPSIIFQRGTLGDTLNDYKIVDTSGYLTIYQQGNSGTTGFTQVARLTNTGEFTINTPPASNTTPSTTAGFSPNDSNIKIATDATIASGDKIVIRDTSDSNKMRSSSITFGSSTTQFLANNGTWQTPAGGVTGVQIDGTSIVSSGVANIVTSTAHPYSSTNVLATMGDIAAAGGGTVTSVGVSNATNGGLSVSGSPITSSGTITIGHSNVLTNAQTTQAVYPIKIDKNGHISGYGSAVTIPTKTSQLTNDSSFITASGAPVQSVNGQTGAVSLTIPDEISDLTNDMVYDLGTITPDTSTGVFSLTETQRSEISTMWNKGFCAIRATVGETTYWALKENNITYNNMSFMAFTGVWATINLIPVVGKTLIGISSSANIGIFAYPSDLTSEDIDLRASSADPIMDGTAYPGTSTQFSRADHVHPTDTSRQATLVSGTNIKTINNESILGSGNITIQGGGTATDVKINGTSITSSGVANIVTNTAYNASTNKIATMNDLPVLTFTPSGNNLIISQQQVSGITNGNTISY